MNKNQPINLVSAVIGLLALLALGISLSFALKQNPAILQPIATTSSTQQCVPTPHPPTDTGTKTSTPALSEYGTPPLTHSPSVTPLPISAITDLATDLPDEDKVYVYVFRCNGTFELFLVRPGGPNADIATAIPLQPGDVIWDWIPPASIIGHYAPQVTFTTMPFPTPTLLPYPVPMTPAETPTATSSALPYPPPGAPVATVTVSPESSTTSP